VGTSSGIVGTEGLSLSTLQDKRPPKKTTAVSINTAWLKKPLIIFIFATKVTTFPEKYKFFGKIYGSGDFDPLRDHQEYCKKIAMKTGTHTQVPTAIIISFRVILTVE
jgi:hypothetical protein